MGNCKSWVHKQQEPARKLTLAILGLDNAGKTVTTKGLQGESLDNVAPTIGFSSVDFKFEKHSITMYDLGGGSRIRDIWKKYFSDIYGLVYVVDSSEPERMEECREVLKNLLEHPKVAGKPVLILANKQDIHGALDEIDVCEYLDLEETVNMNKCPCRVETCSAILGQGKKIDKSIHSGFSWLINVIMSNYDKLHQRVEKDVEEVREKEEQAKKERMERVQRQREEREKKKKEERALRGEPDTDEEGDIVDGADPFKKLNREELERKEQQLKEEKQRKKLSRFGEGEDDEDSEEMKLSSRKKKLGADYDSDGENVPRQPPMKSSLTPRALPPIERSPRLSHRSYPNTNNDNGDSDSELRASWNNKSITPRPDYGTASLDLAQPRLGGSRSYDDGLLDRGGLAGRGRGGLAPLAPLAPLSPLEPLDSDKKKKKKKKPKRNQTSPSQEDDDELTPGYGMSSTLNGLDLQDGPRSWSSGGQSRSLLKASRSPRLETLQEPENGEEVYSSGFNKYGLEDGLPELAPEVSSRRGTLPNSDYDSIMT